MPEKTQIETVELKVRVTLPTGANVPKLVRETLNYGIEQTDIPEFEVNSVEAIPAGALKEFRIKFQRAGNKQPVITTYIQATDYNAAENIARGRDFADVANRGAVKSVEELKA